MFIPQRFRRHSRDNRSWCRWCCARQSRGQLFKLRDGPIDYYFCDETHAELWLEFRHTEAMYTLCKMLPRERRARLGARQMSDEISRHFPDRCGRSQP